MSFQLNVRTDIKDILIYFPSLKIIIIESTCLKVKYLDIYIVETECKFIQFSLLLFFEYKEFFLI